MDNLGEQQEEYRFEIRELFKFYSMHAEGFNQVEWRELVLGPSFDLRSSAMERLIIENLFIIWIKGFPPNE